MQKFLQILRNPFRLRVKMIFITPAGTRLTVKARTCDLAIQAYKAFVNFESKQTIKATDPKFLQELNAIVA